MFWTLGAQIGAHGCEVPAAMASTVDVLDIPVRDQPKAGEATDELGEPKPSNPRCSEVC